MLLRLFAIVLACSATLPLGCGSRDSAQAASARTADAVAPGATRVAGAAFLARCRAAAEYSRKHDGEVLLVLLHGKPVFEDSARGFDARTPHALAMGTKSFSGVAAAFAVEDGLLRLDEPVSGTIVEWKGDPRKSKITVRQLLSLASGLESPGGSIENPRVAREAGLVDRAAASIAARTVAEPGARFVCGPSSFYVFGELVRRKLFGPLGIEPRFVRD